jgi:hypothetical protein
MVAWIKEHSMDFDTFIDQAWTDHASDPAAVAATLQAQGLARVSDANQLGSMAHLAHHVLGSHLARWEEGLQFQQQLAALPCCEAGSVQAQAIARHISALRLAGGLGDDRADLGASDRIRLTAMAANNLAEHDATRAEGLLLEALSDAEQAGLPDSDPFHRALAIAGNNIAGTLEEKPMLSAGEVKLMIQAAQAGLRHWAIAGTWLETERAEYRLCLSWLKAGDIAQARVHAQRCLQIVQDHGNVPLETFFAWVVTGQVEQAAGNASGLAQALSRAQQAFNGLAESDRGWCQASLDKLQSTAAAT